MRLFKNTAYISSLLNKWGNWKLTSATGSGSSAYYLASRSKNGLEEVAGFRLLTLSRENIEMDGGSFQDVLDRMKADIRMTKMYQKLPNLVAYNEAAMFSKDNGAQMDVLLRLEPIESLSSIIQAKSITEQAAVRVGIDISNALATLESLETSHLNLQPNSIVADRSGEFKLIPPPLSGEQPDPERARFAAPELRAQGTKLSKADQYSLGMILYWMLNDFSLPEDRNTGGTSAYPPPCNADSHLAGIILRACSKSPEARFPSAKDLHRELETYLRNPLDFTQPDGESEPESKYTVAVPAMVMDNTPPERLLFSERPKPVDEITVPDPMDDAESLDTVFVPAMDWDEESSEREAPPERRKPPEQAKPPEPVRPMAEKTLKKVPAAPRTERRHSPAKPHKTTSQGSKKKLLIPLVAAILLIAGLGFYIGMGKERTDPMPVSPTEVPVSRVPHTQQAVTGVQLLSQPVDYTGALGEEFAFSVTVEGKVVSYQWQCRSDSNWTDAELDGSDTATVSGKILGELVGTQYRCRITDDTGKVMYSEAATLRTTAAFYVAVQPKDFMGKPGDTFELSVQSVGARDYQWEFLRNTQWEDAEMRGSDTDTICGEVTEELMGRVFRCRMTGEDGTVFCSDEAALVDVSETVFRMQPMDHIGELGESFAFAVSAPDAQSYEWQYKDGETWKPTSLFGCKTDTISGVITEELLGKVFRCAVTDAVGNAHFSREVSILVSFAILQQPEKKFTGELGSTFTFHVTAVGAQSYQWQYLSGGMWLAATNLDGNQTDTATGKIISARVGTKYRCRIIDIEGNEHFSEEVLLWSESAPSSGGSGGGAGGGSSGGSGGGSSGESGGSSEGGPSGSYGSSGSSVVRLSLGGVEFDSAVTSLNLQKKGITDISVLAQCTDLTWLNLNNNQISDLTPLKNLNKLESLFLNNNMITDISALAGLKNLKTLQLQKNAITDWSPVDFLAVVAGRP